MTPRRSLKEITLPGLLIYDSDRPVMTRNITEGDDFHIVNILIAASNRSKSETKNDVFDYCFGPEKWEKYRTTLDMIMAFRLQVQPNQHIPRYSEYVLSIEGPPDMTLKLISREEKFKPVGPFLLHPYFDVIVETGSKEPIWVTYVVLTDAFRNMLLSYPNFYQN